VIAGGTAVRLLLAAVLEVRDHATQQVLAGTHIQLFAMDAYDYDDCVRRMSGVFLLQGCIDVESIDADLRLQLCDIEDPPTMMLTVMQDQEWSNSIEIIEYFEEGEGGSDLFQDPIKSWWIDMEETPTGLNPRQAGIVSAEGDGPAPFKKLRVRPCYDGTIVLQVTNREPADGAWEYKANNALDDGLPKRDVGFFDWQQSLLRTGLRQEDPDSWIDIPAAMINLTQGTENPDPQLSADFGTEEDLAIDDSHLEYGDQHPNVKAIHGGWSLGPKGEPDSELSEPFTMSTIIDGGRRKYPVKGRNEYLFEWDGRQMKLVDKINTTYGQMGAIDLLADCFGAAGKPLYFPPGRYRLQLTYEGGGSGETYVYAERLFDRAHDISFAYKSALCINAWSIMPYYEAIDVASIFHDVFNDPDHGICSTLYCCNFSNREWDWTCPPNSGLIASMLSYSPVVIYDGHGAEDLDDWGWDNLLMIGNANNPHYQCGYPKDFVFLAMCDSDGYYGYLDPSPLVFWGYKGDMLPEAAGAFMNCLLDASRGDAFHIDRTIVRAFKLARNEFKRRGCPYPKSDNDEKLKRLRKAWATPDIRTSGGGGDLCFKASTGNEDNGVFTCN